MRQAAFILLLACCVGCESRPPIQVTDNSLYVKELEAVSRRQAAAISDLLNRLNAANDRERALHCHIKELLAAEEVAREPEPAAERSVLVEKHGADAPSKRPPGPCDSWTTLDGYVWDGRKWFKPWHGTPQYPARPLGTGGLWNDGIPYDHPVSRKIQRWEREAAEQCITRLAEK